MSSSSGKAPIAKRDYNSPVTMKGWLYRQVNTVTFISSLRCEVCGNTVFNV